MKNDDNKDGINDVGYYDNDNDNDYKDNFF